MYFLFMDDVTFGSSGLLEFRGNTSAESDVYECLVIIGIFIIVAITYSLVT